MVRNDSSSNVSSPGFLASATTRGILFMALASASISIMHTGVRYVSADVHPFEVAFLRNVFTLVFTLPLMIQAGRSAWRSKAPKLQFGRSVIGVVSTLMWFYALANLPLAESTSLSFTTGIFLTIGAALFLGEKVGPRRWSAVLIGFIGTLIVLRPGFHDIGLGAIGAIGASALWAMSLLIMKVLGRKDGTVTIVFYSSLYLTLLSFPAALYVWTWPSLETLGVIVFMSACATASHLALTTAFKLADATAVMPIDFTRLIWVSILAYVLFAEVPEPAAWIGGSIIFASALYITYRESRIAQQAETTE